MKNKIVVAITWLFTFLFVYAAANKLMDVQKFRIQLLQSPLITTIAGFTSWAIPSLEVAIAIMLATRYRLIGLYASFTLMAMFTAYIIAILKFSSYVPCSCGGILEHFGWTEHLVFNLMFCLLGIIGVLLHQAKPSHDIANPR